MKYRYIIYSFCLLSVLWTACSDTETLENKIDFSSPYVISDDPNDPVQHHRYQIYQQYGVPVFFNDTISKTYTGTDYDGEPIYHYETLDLNWSFSSHNKKNVTYIVDYCTDPELQLKALEFVDAFLARASKPMRPFSIFLPNSLGIKENDKNIIESPEYWSGFRTLVIPNVQNVEQENIPAFSTKILLSMVKDKTMKASDIVERFGEVSDKNKYYDKPWVNDGSNGGLGCQWGVVHVGTYWKPSKLYEEDICQRYIWYYWDTHVQTEEEFETERATIFQQIGTFGFICGQLADRGMLEHLRSPQKITEDMEYYLDVMLEIGSEKFIERYGSSPLVLKKYTILANYINNVLCIEF